MSQPETLRVRVYGRDEQPTLVYLPGLHGDWTLIGGFRAALRGRVRFVEMTYPRTLTWTLDDYAAAIEKALAEEGITSGWLLGESFGSQVLWALVARGKFSAPGLILAGGFIRHPIQFLVRLAQRVGSGLPLRWITSVLFGYARIARYRFRHSPQVLAGIQEFIERRTELDRQAAIHRLRLIAGSNFCRVASQCRLPVFGLTGLWDPVVPWIFVRHWLSRSCAALRDYRIIPTADHNVLGTAPQRAADQVVAWMGSSDR